MSNFANYLIEISKYMACIISIETSTNVCSVAASENGKVIFHEEDFSGPNHAERLGVYVDEALSFIDSHAIPLDAVAVSQGPGSYTGLRIGVSMAKGICYGRSIPLIAVPPWNFSPSPYFSAGTFPTLRSRRCCVPCSTHGAWRSMRLSTTARYTRCAPYRLTLLMVTHTASILTNTRFISLATVLRSVWRP